MWGIHETLGSRTLSCYGQGWGILGAIACHGYSSSQEYLIVVYFYLFSFTWSFRNLSVDKRTSDVHGWRSRKYFVMKYPRIVLLELSFSRSILREVLLLRNYYRDLLLLLLLSAGWKKWEIVHQTSVLSSLVANVKRSLVQRCANVSQLKSLWLSHCILHDD